MQLRRGDKGTRTTLHAARPIAGTHEHQRGLSWLLRDDLHWLTVPQLVQYKLAVSVHRCLWYGAPTYLADCCVPVSEVSSRQHLSASRRKLYIPRFRPSTFGTTRAFSVADPTVLNSLPDSLHDPAVESERFRRDLKTHLFVGHERHERTRGVIVLRNRAT